MLCYSQTSNKICILIYIEMFVYRYRIIKSIKNKSLISIKSNIEIIKNEIINFYEQ